MFCKFKVGDVIINTKSPNKKLVGGVKLRIIRVLLDVRMYTIEYMETPQDIIGEIKEQSIEIVDSRCELDKSYRLKEMIDDL